MITREPVIAMYVCIPRYSTINFDPALIDIRCDQQCMNMNACYSLYRWHYVVEEVKSLL